MRITFQYCDYLPTGAESDVLVMPMRAYDLVLELRCFRKP
jgi:hypothetical protein